MTTVNNTEIPPRPPRPLCVGDLVELWQNQDEIFGGGNPRHLATYLVLAPTGWLPYEMHKEWVFTFKCLGWSHNTTHFPFAFPRNYKGGDKGEIFLTHDLACRAFYYRPEAKAYYKVVSRVQ